MTVEGASLCSQLHQIWIISKAGIFLLYNMLIYNIYIACLFMLFIKGVKNGMNAIPRIDCVTISTVFVYIYTSSNIYITYKFIFKHKIR